MQRINAVAAIRVSTTKQGTDGDSPEAQKEQIERYAQNKGIEIKKFFVFMESASKEQQPMQEAVDYCKDPKNDISLFIIKSIDRFTRGGSLSYDLLKNQLELCNVSLVDIYGIISSQQVNTLEHLEVEYKWSVYSPTKKSEILEAERSKDELRDILSRMIGAEVRYTRMGYWMRQPPYGFDTEKIETQHGKRTILKPNKKEAYYVRKIFELRAQGTKTDTEIVEIINGLGFKTRKRRVRSKSNKHKVVDIRGSQPLTVKAMNKIVVNPIYAGINSEKWTNYQPVKCAFKGLVSIQEFNRANKGKLYIDIDDQGEYVMGKNEPEDFRVDKGRRNAEFAFRKVVLCPTCDRPLLGSASRGKMGKYYPAYHCSNHGHYFRVPKDTLEKQVTMFMSSMKVSEDHLSVVMEKIEKEYSRRLEGVTEALQRYDERLEELRSETEMIMDKIKVLTSETAIKYLEEDLVRVEEKIRKLESEKAAKQTQKPINLTKILNRVRYFLEHLDELFEKQIDPVKKAQFFGVIFDKLPTYEELNSGTLSKGSLHPLLDIIKDPSKLNESLMVSHFHHPKSPKNSKKPKTSRKILFLLSVAHTELTNT
ncbi:recombinase family protein [Candidatus Saccharibacteria bacterium]|nr:recombinase family protein [Candidatus Saccharibacteria bacterium]